jgi:hypothetical protein
MKDILLKVWEESDDIEKPKLELYHGTQEKALYDRIHELASKFIKYSVYECFCIIDKS